MTKSNINQEYRTRFTIAHEIGHLVLHSGLFSEISKISTDKEYIDFQNHISIDDHRKLEIQANFFAEEVLFPKDVFRETVEKVIGELGGIDKLLPTDLSLVMSTIEKGFGVTGIAAYNKFKRDYPEVLDRVLVNSPF
ncbi:ImmA/IrrE family metallo-endopeptidase [Candidatus Shapirobacteria bacterium]|nr:ImmA/IrrE family metallo-endopeptidase [Candidatus Shapirobacteria bacterium]